MNAITKPQPANRINGIDVDDVQTLIGAVQDDPANGATHWKVTSSWMGGTHSRAQVDGFSIGGQTVDRRFTIDIDEPHQLAGTDAFANPQEHLLAAVNACMMVGYVALCSLHGITLHSLEIETRGDIDLRGFFALDDAVSPGYDSLEYTVRIKGDASPEQFAEIHEAVQKTSPNFHNMAHAIGMKPKLIVE